jgi:polyisoprenoid-binding protein YceI
VAGTATTQQTAVWQLDPAHSSLGFSVKHMMMTTVRGRFKKMKGTLTADEQHPEGCCVEVEIDAASIDTGVADRDAHLRGPDFLDVETYPTIIFKSKKVEGEFGGEGDEFHVLGDLTIRGMTMQVRLDCTYEGRGGDPWGKERAGFSGHTEIDRRDWGLKWNQALETGGILVANRIRIDVEAQFVKQDQQSG